MKPLVHLAHALFIAVNLASAHLPPRHQCVSEHIVAIETVSTDDGQTEVYFIDKVQGQTRYVDYRWFYRQHEVPAIEYVGGEWRMVWWDGHDDCLRAVYAGNWLVTYCDSENTPKSQLDRESNNGWWIPSGLAQPAGRWW